MTITIPQPLADRFRARFGDDAEAVLIEIAESCLAAPPPAGQAQVHFSEEEWAEIRRRQEVPLEESIPHDEFWAEADRRLKQRIEAANAAAEGGARKAAGQV